MADYLVDLERLGFSGNEAKVYITLIRLGPSFAGRIAKEASMDRSSTYNALKQLIERGIVSTLYENKRTIYVSADPKKIVDYFKEKEELANKIIPLLREQHAVAKEKKKVVLFQGYKGLKTLFQDILDSAGKEYYVIGSEGKFREKMPYYAPSFIKQKEDKGLKAKVIIREGRVPPKKSKYTDYKYLPSAVSPATINIYNGKVSIFMWEEKPEAILIENEKVYATFKSYFDFMWMHAKK